MNEYSLRGQFKNIDEFIETLRTSTLPALNKIQDEKGSILWKKDTFWELEICNGITILNIPQKRNERNMEVTALKSKLRQLCTEKPHWRRVMRLAERAVLFHININGRKNTFGENHIDMRNITNSNILSDWSWMFKKSISVPLYDRKISIGQNCTFSNVSFDKRYLEGECFEMKL